MAIVDQYTYFSMMVMVIVAAHTLLPVIIIYLLLIFLVPVAHSELSRSRGRFNAYRMANANLDACYVG